MLFLPLASHCQVRMQEGSTISIATTFCRLLPALVQMDKENEYVLLVIKGKDNDNRIVMHDNTKIMLP